MRKNFLIILFFLTLLNRAFPQTPISVSCDETWGPGRYNKVTITIDITGSPGFARFTQELPVGLDAVIDDPGSGDFTFADNRLSLVWMKLPEKRKLSFSYFVKPDKLMNGSISIAGKFVTVSEGTIRRSVSLKERTITIDGTNGILPDQMKAGQVVRADAKPLLSTSNKAVEQSNRLVYRVQVSVTSTPISEGEFRKKHGFGKDIQVRIVQSGKLFKYQAGEYSSYKSADGMLKQVVEKGWKDAFIVAFRDGKQIPVAEALESQK